MEAFAVIGLVANIIQFVDLSSKLVSKSAQLYRSNEGTLAENIDIGAATIDLVLLNDRLQNAAATTGDRALERLCISCNNVANDLITALDRVKVKSKHQKWESIKTALRSVLSRKDIMELQRRLEILKEELSLHIVVDLRWVLVSLNVGPC